MSDRAFLDRYSNKQIEFTFDGAECSFFLSQGLFSSFDIDAGTRMLLKTVAERIDLGDLRSVLDVGCGIGVIGICVAKKAPAAACILQDRDALAVRISGINARLNKVSAQVQVVGDIAFQGLPQNNYDLIVSNLPAKAGMPVLDHMMRCALEHISSSGSIAAVVVLPLAEALKAVVLSAGGRITYSEESHEHCVIHVVRESSKQTGNTGASGAVDSYMRRAGSFIFKKRSYRLETAYNLPSFDTLGRNLELAYGLADRFLLGAGDLKKILVWNPGHGHFPCYLSSQRNEAHSITYYLASHDALQLAVTTRNLTALGIGRENATFHVPDLDSLSASMGADELSLMAVFPRPIPGVQWYNQVASFARAFIRKGGYLLVSSTSTEIHRVQQALKGMAILGNKKDRGSRAIICKKT